MRRSILVLAMTCVAAPAQALQLGDEDKLLSIEIHGFASPGAMFSTNGNNYLGKTTKPTAEFFEVGINFTKQITDNFRVGLQLFSRQLGPIANYVPRVDWFYIDYKFRDWLGFRAGRVKLPFGLYNEVNDIDAARVPILLPQSMYPTTSRDFLLAQTGGELYGYLSMGAGGALDYRAYAGTIFLDTTQPADGSYRITNLRVPFIVGGRVIYETPVRGLRIAGSVQYLQLDTSFLFTSLMPPANVNATIPALLWVVSAEYAWRDLTLSAEYSRWHVRVNSDNTGLLPSGLTTSERAYVMATYRVNSWFYPGVYYSMQFPNANVHFATRASDQNDVAATLRFDIIENHWLIKVEGHYMNGTAGLTPTLNDNKPLTALSPNWAMFLVKTTGYF